MDENIETRIELARKLSEIYDEIKNRESGIFQENKYIRNNKSREIAEEIVTFSTTDQISQDEYAEKYRLKKLGEILKTIDLYIEKYLKSRKVLPKIKSRLINLYYIRKEIDELMVKYLENPYLTIKMVNVSNFSHRSKIDCEINNIEEEISILEKLRELPDECIEELREEQVRLVVCMNDIINAFPYCEKCKEQANSDRYTVSQLVNLETIELNKCNDCEKTLSKYFSF